MNIPDLPMSPVWVLASTAVLASVLPVYRRIQLSRAKHRSLAGHSKWSKRIARMLPFYEWTDDSAWACDGADAQLVHKRGAGFYRLAAQLQAAAPTSLALSQKASQAVSDMQFISRYRVPFQFSGLVCSHLKLGSFAHAAGAGEIEDMDGNRLIDLTGSYGVNVFGIDFYRDCMDQAHEQARVLGPVLGSYHPCVAQNVETLQRLSGLEEVSFHMSGTEAVMQAVRLARYHTRKRYLVRFCGAYHGWWGDVQPGIGNPSSAHDTLTLADMSERTLAVLASRHDIACVLINPLQALHPNSNAPGDSSLIHGRQIQPASRQAYGQWLRRLAEVCKRSGIVLILDEVFVGFRLGLRGAQGYFDVQADMVTYGKTLGGGFPVGVLCGRSDLMRRFRQDRPVDICFARGTFNAHPHVMAAMQVFLQRLDTQQVQGVYANLDSVWAARLQQFNQAMQVGGFPVRAVALSSIWSLNFQTPSRFHWMLQFYLRQAGLALSWVGTGRFIFSLTMTDTQFAQMLHRVVHACNRMQADGWWTCPMTAKQIKRQVLGETMRAFFSGAALRAPGRSTDPASDAGEQTSTA